MSKLPTDEELKERWQQEKIARKHQDAAEVMYEAPQEIHQWLGAHTIATAEDIALSVENIEKIAKAALAVADGVRFQPSRVVSK